LCGTKQEKMNKRDYLNCIFDILNANGLSENERELFVETGNSGYTEYDFQTYFGGERYSFKKNKTFTSVQDNRATCKEINKQLKTFTSKYKIDVANPIIETVKLLMDEPNFVPRLTAFINDFIDELQNAGEAASDN